LIPSRGRVKEETIYSNGKNGNIKLKKGLIQIRDSGHGLMYQFPDKFTKVVSTFLAGG
jgi:pimeloyl-ACP methyl ester carboxylesterase